MPAAIALPLIGAGVSAVAGLGAAKIQSNAAQKAQTAQQAATDKALAVQQEQSAPYRQLGQQGVDRLTALGAPQPYTQQFRATGSGPQSNGYQAFNPNGGAPTLGGIGGFAAQPNGLAAQPGGRSGPPLQGQPPPQMVTLQAPDGSTRQFPAMQAQQVMQQAKQAGHELRMVQ